jgi:hypothetical protein
MAYYNFRKEKENAKRFSKFPAIIPPKKGAQKIQQKFSKSIC